MIGLGYEGSTDEEKLEITNTNVFGVPDSGSDTGAFVRGGFSDYSSEQNQ